MRIRQFFDSKKLEAAMISAGKTGADIHRDSLKKGSKLNYDSFQRVLQGRTHRQKVVAAICDVLGVDIDQFKVKAPKVKQDDGRSGKRRKARNARPAKRSKS